MLARPRKRHPSALRGSVGRHPSRSRERVSLELEELRGLVDEVGRFYVRDRALDRAQRAMTRPSPRAANRRSKTCAPISKRSGGISPASRTRREAHLQRVEARLKRVSQEQFNLTAERGVAARRVEATRSVLSRLPGRRT